MSIKQLIFGIILLSFFASCNDDEDGDLCGPCEAAIAEMHNRLPDVACDPDSLPAESAALRQECGITLGNYSMGYLAWICSNQPDASLPSCQETSGARQLSEETIDGVKMTFTFETIDPFNTDMRIVAEKALGSDSQTQEIILKVGETTEFEFDDNNNGELIRFSVFDVFSGDLYESEDQRIFFYRPGNWETIRHVRLFWDESVQLYDLEFEFW